MLLPATEEDRYDWEEQDKADGAVLETPVIKAEAASANASETVTAVITATATA